MPEGEAVEEAEPSTETLLLLEAEGEEEAVAKADREKALKEGAEEALALGSAEVVEAREAEGPPEKEEAAVMLTVLVADSDKDCPEETLAELEKAPVTLAEEEPSAMLALG